MPLPAWSQAPDFDSDGISDSIDNCSEVVNPAQDDTDGDDCGNLCDADYDGNGVVDYADFIQFKAAFLSIDEQKNHVEPIPGRAVGLQDFNVFRSTFLGVPGPSGTTAGTTACP